MGSHLGGCPLNDTVAFHLGCRVSISRQPVLSVISSIWWIVTVCQTFQSTAEDMKDNVTRFCSPSSPSPWFNWENVVYWNFRKCNLRIFQMEVNDSFFLSHVNWNSFKVFQVAQFQDQNRKEKSWEFLCPHPHSPTSHLDLGSRVKKMHEVASAIHVYTPHSWFSLNWCLCICSSLNLNWKLKTLV